MQLLLIISNGNGVKQIAKSSEAEKDGQRTSLDKPKCIRTMKLKDCFKPGPRKQDRK